MLSGRRYNSIKPFGSAVNQWLDSIPRADYILQPSGIGYRDLKSIFLLKKLYGRLRECHNKIT